MIKLKSILSELSATKPSKSFDNKEKSEFRKLKRNIERVDVTNSYIEYKLDIGDYESPDRWVMIRKELERKSNGNRFRYIADETINDGTGDYNGEEVFSDFVTEAEKLKELSKFIKKLKNTFDLS